MVYGKRVHIIPVGDDVERMVRPAIEMQADVVYLLAHTNQKSDVNGGGAEAGFPGVDWTDPDSVQRYLTTIRDQGFETVASAIEKLAEHRIEVMVEFVDQHDVYSVLGLVTTLTHRRSTDDDVVVNVSTGTRLATIGAAMARMDEDTDAVAYHVPDTDTETISDPDQGVADVPDYHLESPSRDALAAMAIIATRDTERYTPKKSDLIDWALRLRAEAGISIGYADRIVQSRLDRNPKAPQPTGFDDLDSTGKKGAYRTLRTSVLDGLRKRDYVTVDDEQVGRADLVTLQPAGEAALRAFRHKILDVIDALAADTRVESLPASLRTGITDRP